MEDQIYLDDIISIKSLVGKIKLVRHYDARIKLNEDKGGFKEFVKFGLLDEYQRYQGKDILNCDYIVSFYGEPNSKAVFYGIYKVVPKGKNAPPLSEYFMNYWNGMKVNEQTYFYELEELQEYRKFRNRVVITWGVGSSTRSWHQWSTFDKRKEVVELRPVNFIGEFPGWKNVILDYIDLKKMIDNPDSHRNWYDELTKVSAVYAIVDKSNGKIYIGSAYGEAEGLWGRWSTYANKPTGGNQLLIELEKSNNRFYEQFQYCILEILPRGVRKEDIIGLEQLTKRKLGKKVCILNAN